MIEVTARTAGTLYIVAMPIGNRADISQRALDTLQSVDLILAEDTRHSMPLLQAWGIKKPVLSLHAHNEANKSQFIIDKLREGQSCALISDAGTPLVNDPGFPLVRLARSQSLSVVPIPGACALITALSAAGVACDTFTFAGFLPAKQSARREKLKSLSGIDHTLIFYESTHRLIDCMDDIASVFGDKTELVLAKELTKVFERFVSGHLEDVKAWLLSDSQNIKGEFVLIIPPRTMASETDIHDRLLAELLRELPLKQAVTLVCKITGAHKNELYKRALALQKNE